jgi:hypothetical protein
MTVIFATSQVHELVLFFLSLSRIQVNTFEFQNSTSSNFAVSPHCVPLHSGGEQLFSVTAHVLKQ